MIDVLLNRFHRLHMVGIGGAGMSGIAEVLLDIGFRITGSDLNENESIIRLRELGAVVYIGHEAEYVHDAEVVVHSSAVHNDHVELVAARKRKIPVIRRSEMLAELMRLKAGIAISGAHGKTTTTSLTGEVLKAAGVDPTVIVGGKLRHLGGGVVSGKGEFLVTEADEYDQSFLRLAPTMVVITNIDKDHLECYNNSYSELEDAFVQFANSVPFYGRVIICLDEPSLLPILPKIRRPVVTYGFSPHADIRAIDPCY
ncbi:MAG: Mur ligase domain-containing protein [Candidatus Electryoneaceae bacterium]|nr:Mur ligase domain-containing protein [Candidatus Electryoneaceae bacterium]